MCSTCKLETKLTDHYNNKILIGLLELELKQARITLNAIEHHFDTWVEVQNELQEIFEDLVDLTPDILKYNPQKYREDKMIQLNELIKSKIACIKKAKEQSLVLFN